MPSEKQKEQIEHHFGCCRLIWNLALAVKKQAYEGNKINISRYDLQKQLVELKKEYRWFYDVNSQSLQSVLLNLDNAYKSFFKKGGFPKFKKKSDHQSFSCPQKVLLNEGFIKIPKISNIPIILSRKFDGKIKTVTISKTSTGKYFASILVENNCQNKVPPEKCNGIGIDLGVSSFAILSTGNKIDNPKYLKQAIDRFKILQRRASKKKNGSSNRKKSNLRVALLHEKITNQRKDFLHKLSSKLISDNQTDTICLESLSVKNMVKNHSLAQAISDVSWSEFVRQLKYKGLWYGKNIIKIDKWFPSSKVCSKCNHKKEELNLDEREWRCSNCNTIHDRDINAAINIKNSGMGSPGEPVEQRTIVRAKKQEYVLGLINI